MYGFKHHVVVFNFNGRMIVLDPTINQFRMNGRLPPAVMCVEGMAITSLDNVGVVTIDRT